MPSKDENTFLFDTNPFLNGLKKIGRQMAKLPQTAGKVASGVGNAFKTIKNKIMGVGKSTGNVAGNVVKGMQRMAIKAGIVALAFKGVQKILSNMPEIGQAFGIAKDIFTKNLLYPLRKAVFPYLRKLLDWARNNRVTFLKWGQVLVNVFNVVANAVKGVIEIGKKLVSAFKVFFERTFGVTINNMQELMNILSLKFAVVMLFLQDMISSLIDRLTPLIETFGEIFNVLIKSFMDFVKGFVKGLNTMDKKYGIIKQINNTFKSFKKLLDELSPILEPLGELLGKVFGVVLLKTFQTLESVLTNITKLIKVAKGEMDFKELGVGKTIKEGLRKTFMPKPEDVVKDGIIKRSGSIIKTSPSQTIFTRKVKDAIIKKDGSVIETSPDDNLIATKNNIALGNPSKTISVGNIRVDFTGMQIILQNGSREEAVGVGESIVDTIRRQLQLEFESMGA